MVQLLLQFIRAERTGDWKFHLLVTAAMTPHFIAMNRQNYSRWLPVYIADMYLLSETHSVVHREFMNGSHAVSHSCQPFAQVWTDMALEQSINRDSKTKGGIIGISQKPGSLERWFLTCHTRAAMTMEVKEICGLQESERMGTHKDVGQNRRRDEKDVQKLMSTLTSGTIHDPFFSLDEDSEDNIPLINIAMGVVMPTDMTNSINSSYEQGAARLKTIVEQRLNTDKVSFWCAIPKLSISMFQTLSKKVVLAKDKISVLVSDRDLFDRLVIAGRSRNINMEEVLSYELTTVPYSLAHMDGSLRKTTKSELLSELEKKVDVQANLPPVFNGITSAHLIDAMASVQILKGGSCMNFGDLAVKHYDAITAPLGLNGCMQVDVIFDQYNELSIKAGEHD